MSTKVYRNKAKDYSLLDRTVHKLAFGSKTLQNILADLEESLYGRQWRDIPITRPIFVTSLARAGTTVLLRALSRVPHVATHTYRDMPFVLTPLIWSKLSGRLQSQAVSRERSHGDGLEISQNSPEAFEEVLWKKYFPTHYRDDGIVLWEHSDTAFEVAFKSLIRKLILLRQGDTPTSARYVSKNNANIARVDIIQAIFHDATILVPLRNPVEHAISLLRQHENFLSQHRESAFAQRYMADIGHYEFGALHRPLLFPGLSDLVENTRPDSVDYWLAYWVATFESLQQQKNITLIRYQKLNQHSDRAFAKLCEILGLPASTADILEAAEVFRGAPPSRAGDYTIDPVLSDRALSIYEQLCRRCILNG